MGHGTAYELIHLSHHGQAALANSESSSVYSKRALRLISQRIIGVQWRPYERALGEDTSADERRQ